MCVGVFHMAEEPRIHILMVSFPGQGHVNPLLRFAKRLASKGLMVTFATTEKLTQQILCSNNNILSTTIGKGQLRFDFFSDGWEIDRTADRHNLDSYLPQLKKAGSLSLKTLVTKYDNESHPVSCIVNNPFVPWAMDVAAELGIPCAMLWVQSWPVYTAYHHYFHCLTTFPTPSHIDIQVQLPGLPLLATTDLPTSLIPNNPYTSLLQVIREQFQNLFKASWVFINSFEELDRDALQLFSPIKPVGPLVSALLLDDAPNVNGDLWKAADCKEWLDSQQPSSVVYVSVGSVVVLSPQQMEEMACGIRDSRKPFLLVVRTPEMGLPDGFLEETDGRGLMVQWCPQVQVLSHPSIACFLTHCGWNSTLETMAAGVPVIAFPQWGDQVTNAKFMVDIYGIGVRLRTSEVEGLVGKEEVRRCIAEVTDGPRANEMRKNAEKLKDAAREAVADGGSSDQNIQAFVDDVSRRAATRTGSQNLSRLTAV